MYVRRCSGCHSLPMPDAKDEAQWAKVLDEMSKEAKLTANERVLVERFLLTMRTPTR